MTIKSANDKEQPNTWTGGGQAKSSDVAASLAQYLERKQLKEREVSVQTDYRCGGCEGAFATFAAAAACCKAQHVECPLSDLPVDAELGHGKAYGYGTVFSGGWEIVHNHGTPDQPVRVYPLPQMVRRAMTHLSDARYEAGKDDAKAEIRKALGA